MDKKQALQAWKNLSNVNTKTQIATTSSILTPKTALKQWQSTNPQPTKKITPKPKKVGNVTIKLVTPKKINLVEQVTTRAKNLISNLTTKTVSPLPEETKPQKIQPIKIKPGQKKIDKVQLQALKGVKPTVLKPAEKQTVWDKLRQIFEPDEDVKARAMNAYQMQKLVKEKTGKTLSLNKLAEKGGNPLKNTLMEDVTKELGIRDVKTTSELGQALFTVAIAAGLATAPVATAVGVGLFTAVNELKSGLISAIKGKGFKLGTGQTLSDVFENAPADVKNVLDLVDFLATAKISHKIYKSSPKVFEKLTKDIIVKNNLPKTVNIPASEVRRVVIGTNKGIERDLLSNLGLSGKEWKNAVNKGIIIEVPAEKITTIVDKPYWRRLKAILGKEPTNRVTITREGKPNIKEGAAAFLTEGEKTPQQAIGEVIKTGKQNTPEGKEIVKTALEAQKTGQNIMIEKPKPKVAQAPINDLSTEARKYKSAEEFESAILGGKIKPEKMKEMGFEFVNQGRIKSPQGMELTDIWNKAQAPKVNPKIVSVPREQLPVGEGEKKVSRLEARLKGVIGKATPEQIEALGLSTSNTANNDKQLSNAAKYVVSNPKEALDVLQGKLDPPKGMLKNAVFVAMTKYVKDDINLVSKLVGLSSKRYGQEIQILSEIDESSVVNLSRIMLKTKEEGLTQRYEIKEANEIVNKRINELTNRVRRGKVKRLAKTNWNAFINSITTC